MTAGRVVSELLALLIKRCWDASGLEEQMYFILIIYILLAGVTSNGILCFFLYSMSTGTSGRYGVQYLYQVLVLGPSYFVPCVSSHYVPKNEVNKISLIKLSCVLKITYS